MADTDKSYNSIEELIDDNFEKVLTGLNSMKSNPEREDHDVFTPAAMLVLAAEIRALRMSIEDSAENVRMEIAAVANSTS